MRKSIKRIVSVFAVCGMLVTGINISAEENSNTFTDKVITYEKMGANTAKIVKCSNKTTSVNIPEEMDGYKITAVAEKAFAECESLKEVTLPDSITEMGNAAFYGCTSLKKVRFTGGIDTVPEQTFCYCTSLKDVELPETVKNIEPYAFAYCIALDEFSIPSSVENIGSCAFYCSQMSDDLVIPEGVKTISDMAFSSCAGMKTVSLPKSLGRLDPYAFFACADLCEFKTAEGCMVTAEDGILYGKDKMTLVCFPAGKAVEDLKLPDSVKTIGKGAFFANTSLKSIDLGNVTSIGEGAFSNCTALEKLEFPDSLTEIPANGFTDCESLWSVTLPDSIKEIGGCAFFNCKKLKSIDIPDSVTRIGEYALGYYEDDEKNKVKMDDFEMNGGKNAVIAGYENGGGPGMTVGFWVFIFVGGVAVLAIVVLIIKKLLVGDTGSEYEAEDTPEEGENGDTPEEDEDTDGNDDNDNEEE